MFAKYFRSGSMLRREYEPTETKPAISEKEMERVVLMGDKSQFDSSIYCSKKSIKNAGLEIIEEKGCFWFNN